MSTAELRLQTWAGLRRVPVTILRETRTRYVLLLHEDCWLPHGRRRKRGAHVMVPKTAVFQTCDPHD